MSNGNGSIARKGAKNGNSSIARKGAKTQRTAKAGTERNCSAGGKVSPNLDTIIHTSIIRIAAKATGTKLYVASQSK